MNTSNNIYLFHEGRGGRFNNGGHVTYEGTINNFDAEYYGIDVYFGFENTEDVLKLIEEGAGCTDAMEYLFRLDFYIMDAACSWHECAQKGFNSLNLKDGSGKHITADMLGEAIVLDCDGNKVLTVAEYNSGNGTFEIDGEYDTYSWRTACNLSEGDKQLIIEEQMRWNGEYADMNILQDILPHNSEEVILAAVKINELDKLDRDEYFVAEYLEECDEGEEVVSIDGKSYKEL